MFLDNILSFQRLLAVLRFSSGLELWNLYQQDFFISMFTKPCIKLIFKNQFASNVISLELSAVCFLLCADKFLPPMDAFANRAVL